MQHSYERPQAFYIKHRAKTKSTFLTSMNSSAHIDMSGAFENKRHLYPLFANIEELKTGFYKPLSILQADIKMFLWMTQDTFAVIKRFVTA